MGWNEFYLFGIASVLCWLTGATFALTKKRIAENKISTYAVLFTLVGELILGVFILLLWIKLERPPLRTMGETRLWYAFFMGCASVITYIKWKYKWILGFSTLLGGVFIILNIVKPEIHDQSLMPALQSIWFIPHVTIYMFSYAILGCAFILSLVELKAKQGTNFKAIDNMVLTGISTLTVGMLLGSLWAKEAWGGYWSWDPKETWAAITWLGYLFYIHVRLDKKPNKSSILNHKLPLFIVIISFAALQMCWWGVNYLPAAQNSVHTYIRK